MRGVFSFVVILTSGIIARADDKPETRHWTIDGVSRTALVHLPANAKTVSCPVVFAFHGHGGLMRDASKEFAIHKNWPEAIVVYMKGLPTVQGNDPEGKESGWQHNPGENGDRDVKFSDAVLDSLRHDFKVDNAQIYVTGFSNGASFTYVLWSTRGDEIAAIAPCAMHATEKFISKRKPKPMLLIAGKTDPLQKFSDLEKTAEHVAKLNHCGDPQPWGKLGKKYPSEDDAPVLFLGHPGGHEVPQEAQTSIVKFFKEHKLK